MQCYKHKNYKQFTSVFRYLQIYVPEWNRDKTKSTCELESPVDEMLSPIQANVQTPVVLVHHIWAADRQLDNCNKLNTKCSKIVNMIALCTNLSNIYFRKLPCYVVCTITDVTFLSL